MATKTVSEITINKIRIGGKAPKKIMKGSTEVMKVTKGSTVVYQKENVVYTLTGSASDHAATATRLTFTIKSYKGSSTAVAISTGNVSVTAGGGSVSSVTASGTTYYVYINVSANTSTTTKKTHTIKVTQPVSGQSITVNCIQAEAIQNNCTATVRWTEYELSNGCPWGLFSGTPSSSIDSYDSIFYSDIGIKIFPPGSPLVVNVGTAAIAVGSYVYMYYYDPTRRWRYIGSFIHQNSSYSVSLP